MKRKYKCTDSAFFFLLKRSQYTSLKQSPSLWNSLMKRTKCTVAKDFTNPGHTVNELPLTHWRGVTKHSFTTLQVKPVSVRTLNQEQESYRSSCERTKVFLLKPPSAGEARGNDSNIRKVVTQTSPSELGHHQWLVSILEEIDWEADN